MMNVIKFLNEQKEKSAEVKYINQNVIQIKGVEINLSGFHVMKNERLYGNFSDFNTLYRTIDDGFQLSNDGSVYVEPEEPEPYEPTLEEVRSQKMSEISSICQQTIYNGIDVQLSSGETKHYSLKTEDQLNLFGKQVQLSTDATRFEYHADGEPCEWYSREDMTRIVTQAMSFVSYNTTYCNSFYKYIKALTDKEKIESLQYGDSIPEEYQSEVMKDYIIQMKA